MGSRFSGSYVCLLLTSESVSPSLSIVVLRFSDHGRLYGGRLYSILARGIYPGFTSFRKVGNYLV